MTTFLEDEASVQESRPREGYHIVSPIGEFFLHSGTRDISIAGTVYYASAIERGPIQLSPINMSKEMTISLPVSHALAQRYNAGGVPPKTISATVWRKQLRSGIVERFWSGYFQSMGIDGRIATFLVPQRSGQALKRHLPILTAQKACPYILYQSGCTVPEASFRVPTTLASVSGRFVSVASMGGQADFWAKNGKLRHVPTGQELTIQSQIGVALRLQTGLVELAVGDAVEVFAGCEHDIVTCTQKFANQVNFGGMPQLPTANPFMPNGFGIYQSS